MPGSDSAATLTSNEVSPREFLAAMGSFAASVTVVTALDAFDNPCALTATAFTSVSKEPPRCLVCIHKQARPRDSILRGARFAVNILRADQEEVAARFASTVEDRFAGVRWHGGACTGAPIIEGVLAWVECEVVQVVSSGDHDIIVGAVLAVQVNDGAPLVYFRGSCATLPAVPATFSAQSRVVGQDDETTTSVTRDPGQAASAPSAARPSTRRFVGDATAAVPEAFRRYLVDQKYDEYTAEDHDVWSEMLRRNQDLVSRYEERVHPEYLAGMRALQLPPRIPRIQEVNERLRGTGWRTVCVDGYVPSSAYAGLMCHRIFPVSRQIRRKEHVEFAPAPDMVHDILGHLAMLFLPQHRDFLQHMAKVMMIARSNQLDSEFYESSVHMANLKWNCSSETEQLALAEQRVADVHRALVTNASELTQLRRMYIWSVEFGLMGTIEQPLLFGAAFFSSFEEFLNVCQRRTPVLRYSPDVVHYENAFSEPLSQYFVARDFDDLERVLGQYEAGLSVAVPRTSEIRGIAAGTPRRQSGNA